MSDNPACITKHRQILAGRCPKCEGPIENGQVSATLDVPPQIRWNWAAIEECLRNGDPESRSQTVWELDDQATSLVKVLPLLALALNDRDPQVKAFAEMSSGRIGRVISKNQVAWLETQRDAAETALAARLILLKKYFTKSKRAIRASRATHIYWIIEHHPERDIAGSPNATIFKCEHAAAYGPAKSLWLQQCAAHPSNIAVLRNAANFFLVNERDLAEKCFRDAQQIEPANPEWHMSLANLYWLAVRRGPEELRSQKARQALVEWEMAEQLRPSPSGVPSQEESQAAELLSLIDTLPNRARAALAAGEFKLAKQFAERCLALASGAEIDKSFRNDGEAIHHSHIVLGRVALHEGNLERAKAHLMKSTTIKESPVLMSFGPNMSLAKELLELGESAVVIEYLDLCGRFWKDDSDRIGQWKDEITHHHIPMFGVNLDY